MCEYEKDKLIEMKLQKLVNEVILMIREFLPDFELKIPIVLKDFKYKTLGEYWGNKILIDIEHVNKDSDCEIIETIIHEIGHYIHDEQFNCKHFRFPTVEKSEYAYANFKENFAEAFTDLIERKDTKERSNRIRKILNCKIP
jgi:Mlc titration factor MtfA (ptsG expression regulator)